MTTHDAASDAAFKQAWARYEAKGYRYGRDALEQVRFGWNIAQEVAALTAKPEQPPMGGDQAGQWQSMETAPKDGYFMVYEDGAYRLRLRHEGRWLDTAYAGIECAPWGDVAVGQDAQRILDMRADAGRYRLVIRDGCCENPTHWMPLPQPPMNPSEPEVKPW